MNINIILHNLEMIIIIFCLEIEKRSDLPSRQQIYIAWYSFTELFSGTKSIIARRKRREKKGKSKETK